MATITGQGTTFDLPDYHGELFVITPTETPFLSAIGGLNGAKRTTATTFEWQTIKRRTSGPNNVALEGAAAPDGTEQPRSNLDNVVEIHQSAIEITYTKMGASGQFSGANIAPQWNDAVLNELSVQTDAELQSMAVDIEQSFLNGTYQKPSDNTSPRQTQGILGAIAASNTVAGSAATYLGTGVTATSGNTITITGTAPGAVGDLVQFWNCQNSGLQNGVNYYVLTISSKVITVSATSGGSAVTILNACTGLTVSTPAAIADTDLTAALKAAFDNGAKLPTASTVLLVGSAQKVALSNTYATPTLNQVTRDRNIAGVDIDTLVTDFGTFGVMLDRWMPNGCVAIVDLSVCYPWFLDIPTLPGLLSVEELARTGASAKFQLYGEIGLEYGPPTYHALLTGLA